jgi:hypothetical protein
MEPHLHWLIVGIRAEHQRVRKSERLHWLIVGIRAEHQRVRKSERGLIFHAFLAH